ncbi:MAG: sirohydrochlorin cobaltochelatase [Propionicimonas sp.]|nr:sirohydrochlorin cobaltochelatase [Propionicimonas sp.]
MKRSVTRIFAGAALLCLTALSACSSNTPPQVATPVASATSAAAPASTPAQAASKVLLVVSFGTSYNDNRDLSIGGVENALQAAYPDYEVRRAFTSQIIIDKLAERDGIRIDNVEQAMARLVADGVQELVIQPTQIMAGYEYMDLVTAITPYQDRFASFAMGSPLLTTEDDYDAVAKAITTRTAEFAAADTAIIFMGHGTSAPSNADYGKLDGILKKNYKNYFVGTVEGTPTLDDVVKEAKTAKVSKVVLQPLMVVAGDHANNDMAGDEADSWKTTFTKAGFEVQTLIEGLGQNADIQQLYVAHAKAAMDSATTTTPVTGVPVETAQAAGEEIAAHQIKPGSYPISATTESSMFKIVDVKLEVEEEKMFATVTLSGDGYGRLVLGTADNAAKATSGFIEFTTDSQGRHVYVVPVSRLNKPMSIAAESGKTPGKWYDQTATFLSEKIPADAISDAE